MKINIRKQYVMTKSNDGCVVIVQSDEKTDQKDVYISTEVLERNVSLGTFTKHETLKHNECPVYVLTEDLKKNI
jgi:hypothetical protein